MTEQSLNDAGVYLEPYGGGFIVADYRSGEDARYCGSDLSWRRQPITYWPFLDKESAVEAVASLLKPKDVKK